MSLNSGPAAADPGTHRSNRLPLTGIRFLEVGEDFACAYAGHLLSLLGADVLRVPAPARARAHGPVAGRVGGPGREQGPGQGRKPAESPSCGLDAGKALFTGETTAETLSRLPVAAAVDPTGSLASAPYPVVRTTPCPTPARAWAASGAMALTGRADGPPLLAPGDLATCLDGAALALRLLAAARGMPLSLDGSALLGERAAIFGYHRNGTVSNGGACRLVADERRLAGGELEPGLRHRTAPRLAGCSGPGRPLGRSGHRGGSGFGTRPGRPGAAVGHPGRRGGRP